ncbi:hypothetical protein J0H58_33175 [bacterium]|nr:hypothetical protein [bacterium]
MSTVIHLPVWDELLDFALSGDKPLDREWVRAALADFGVDTRSANRLVLTALRRAGDGRAEDDTAESSCIPPKPTPDLPGGETRQ